MSPFEADLGYVPHNPLSAVAESSRRGLRGGRRQGVQFTEHQAAVLRQCQDALEDAQARMTDVYDRGRKEQEFNVGDQVYLSTKHFDTAHTGFPNSRKLGLKWIGPYSIVGKVHRHAYQINLPPGLKLHPVFNTGSLKPYESPTRLSRPQEVILHGSSIVQIVEAIIGKRQRKGTVQYLIRWVGELKATWEPLANLHQVAGLIQEFEAKTPKIKKTVKWPRTTMYLNGLADRPDASADPTQAV